MALAKTLAACSASEVGMGAGGKPEAVGGGVPTWPARVRKYTDGLVGGTGTMEMCE